MHKEIKPGYIHPLYLSSLVVFECPACGFTSRAYGDAGVALLSRGRWVCPACGKRTRRGIFRPVFVQDSDYERGKLALGQAGVKVLKW